MPTLGIRQSVWQGLRANQRALMRWAFTKLSLGTSPALYLSRGGGPRVEWFIFDDRRLDLLMFARLGTLANEIAGLPVGWTPPLNPDGTIDRAAVEAEAIARVSASIVRPVDIDYEPDGVKVPNQQQHTLDVNSAPEAMMGWSTVPEEWGAVA